MKCVRKLGIIELSSFVVSLEEFVAVDDDNPPAPVLSVATTHKTFGPTDLTSTYSVCTLRVFGGIEHRTQILRSGVRCSNY
ncbi:hypothetical protein TNCV_2222241 [Trichonephila clavipes]|nr:hypothetical protein TNCV_2222241 [Trichonephila clavipes]